MENIYHRIEESITKGDTSTLKKLLQQKNINLNNGDLYNLNPPLYRASKLGLYEICKILIEYGADVNFTKDHLFYPLEGAASSNHIDIAKLLVNNDADLNGYDLVKISALGAACTKGHYDMMAYLIDCGADINRLNIGTYLSPLDLSIIWEHKRLSKYLIDNGALSNVNRNYDWTTEDGGGISAHIDHYIGRVIPNQFHIQRNGIFYRIAVTNNNNNVLLFSTGNYKYSNPPIEFIMVLPTGWNPYSKILSSSLPYMIMEWLSICLQNGRVFSDGEYISLKEIIDGNDLNSIYNGFYIVDYNYTSSIYDSNKGLVTILSLIPEKKKLPIKTPMFLEKLKGKNMKSLEWKFVPTL